MKEFLVIHNSPDGNTDAFMVKAKNAEEAVQGASGYGTFTAFRVRDYAGWFRGILRRVLWKPRNS